jgi:PAS domain S-box-containing protein
VTLRDTMDRRRNLIELPTAGEASQPDPLLARRDIGFHEAQRLSHTGSFCWQLSPEEITWSEETYRIFEYACEVRPTMELARRRIHPDDLASFEQAVLRAKREGTDFEFEHRLLMPSGAVKCLRVVARAARDESGRLIGFVGAVMDVTAQRSVLTALENAAKEVQALKDQFRRSEAYLTEAQALSRTGSFGWIVATGELFWSPETYCILGYNATIRPSLDLVLKRVHPEDLALVQQNIERASRDATGLDFEHRLLMPDGHVKLLHVVAAPAKDAVDKLEFVGAVMDITERRRAAEALRASEHLARGQLEALTRTLDALAQEADPDKLLEHVMRTIIEQSRAHNVGVWERNDDGAVLDLVALIEDGRFQTRSEALHPAAQLPILTQTHPVWSEVLRTGQHAELIDIAEQSARMRVGSDPSATWHRVLDDCDPDPDIALLKKHLAEHGVRAVLAVPMLLAGRVAGIVAVCFERQRIFGPEEIDLTRALAQQAMFAIHLIRLSQQSRLAAVMAERNRVARDIHDTLAQGLTGVVVQLEAAADAASSGLASEAEAHVGRAQDLARESLKEARRSVLALRPLALEQSNLCDALGAMIRKMTAGTPTRATFRVSGQPRPLAASWEENLLRMGQELLTNALRHARANAIDAQLGFAVDTVRLEFRDDGRGFDPTLRHDGLGLQGIRERVNDLGGRLTIESAPGAGTAIAIALQQAPAQTAWSA